MLEILTVVVFVWLLVKVIGLALKLTWGAAKLIVGLLVALALPVLVLCLLFVGGLALMVPIAVIGVAYAIVKACV